MTLIDRIALAVGRLSALSFAAVILIMVYEVFARYALNAPTIWAHEVSVLLAACGFVFGGAYCMAEGTHMRVTLLVERQPVLSRLSDILSGIVGAVYLAGLTYAAWRMTERAIWRFSLDGSWDPERSGSTLNAPLPAFLKALQFIGALLFLVVVLRRLFARQA